MTMDRLISWTPFGNARLPWTTLFSYIFDYAIIVILAVIYAALDKLVTPFNQRFSLTDITIQYPYAVKERIPIIDAVLISGAFPIVVIIVYTMVVDGIFSHRKQAGRKVWTFKDRLWELNCGILGLLLAQGAAFCITGSLKNLIGRPRPDLIDRCRPPAGAADAPVFGLTSSAICTQTDSAIMQDGFRSFPSGHSSSSFSGLFYLSLYLSGKLHIMDQRGEVWRTVIVIIPTMAAACIASSRIMDYRHHAFDVLFGSALGLLCGWAAYRQYFPPLAHSWLKGRAYPMRDWGVAIKTPPSSQFMEYRSTPNRAADVLNEAEELRYSSPYPPHQSMDQSYNLEPVRPRLPPRPAGPGSENAPMMTEQLDDSDYEHVRPANTQSMTTRESIAAHHTGSTTGGNAFRDQVAANQVRRAGSPKSEQNDDTAYTRPLPDIVVGKPI